MIISVQTTNSRTQSEQLTKLLCQSRKTFCHISLFLPFVRLLCLSLHEPFCKCVRLCGRVLTVVPVETLGLRGVQLSWMQSYFQSAREAERTGPTPSIEKHDILALTSGKYN